MTAARQHEEHDVDVDALRRRLYRADASDADLRRYLDERGPLPESEEPLAALRRPRHGPAIAALASALAICAVTTGVLLHRPATAPATPATPAATKAAQVVVDAGDGRLLPIDPDHLSGPARTAIDIAGQAASAQRFDGLGVQAVPVGLPGAEFGTERAVVVLYSDRASTVSWRVLRLATRRDWSSYQQVLASGRVATHPDSGTPDTFSYAGGPPTEVLVEAPPDLHWTLLVASVSDPTALR